MHSQQKAELNIIYISKKQHKVYHNYCKREKNIYTAIERHIKKHQRQIKAGTKSNHSSNSREIVRNRGAQWAISCTVRSTFTYDEGILVRTVATTQDDSARPLLNMLQSQVLFLCKPRMPNGHRVFKKGTHKTNVDSTQILYTQPKSFEPGQHKQPATSTP